MKELFRRHEAISLTAISYMTQALDKLLRVIEKVTLTKYFAATLLGVIENIEGTTT